MWVNCTECIYFEDCNEKEARDGCYFGMTEKYAEEEFLRFMEIRMCDKAYLHSGSVLTKKQTDILFEFAKDPINIDEEILDKFNNIPN